MYSKGTLASSGAIAVIALRSTSVKAGRARLRGSWRLGGAGIVARSMGRENEVG